MDFDSPDADSAAWREDEVTDCVAQGGPSIPIADRLTVFTPSTLNHTAARAAGGGGSGRGRLAGGEERSRSGGAKRFQPLTRRTLSERSERSERSELCGAPDL